MQVQRPMWGHRKSSCEGRVLQKHCASVLLLAQSVFILVSRSWTPETGISAAVISKGLCACCCGHLCCLLGVGGDRHPTLALQSSLPAFCRQEWRGLTLHGMAR